MREIEFKALFKNIRTSKTCWQHCLVNHKINTSSFIQVSPWLQYTGLKDKNGKKIFEGDIVSRFGEYIVKFGECPDTGIICFYLKGKSNETFTTSEMNASHAYKIIGNIHE